MASDLCMYFIFMKTVEVAVIYARSFAETNRTGRPFEVKLSLLLVGFCKAGKEIFLLLGN